VGSLHFQATNEQEQTGFVPSNYVRKESSQTPVGRDHQSLMDKAKGTFKGMGANGVKGRSSKLPASGVSSSTAQVRHQSAAPLYKHSGQSDTSAVGNLCLSSLLLSAVYQS